MIDLLLLPASDFLCVCFSVEEISGRIPTEPLVEDMRSDQIHTRAHMYCAGLLLNFYSFMMVFMIIAGVTYFILSFVYMDDVAAVSLLRHGGTGPLLKHRHGPP